MPIEWEEATERRLGVVEQKIDKILDPEAGIYPRLSQLEGRLVRWAIAILTTLLGVLVAVIVEITIGLHGGH